MAATCLSAGCRSLPGRRGERWRDVPPFLPFLPASAVLGLCVELQKQLTKLSLPLLLLPAMPWARGFPSHLVCQGRYLPPWVNAFVVVCFCFLRICSFGTGLNHSYCDCCEYIIMINNSYNTELFIQIAFLHNLLPRATTEICNNSSKRQCSFVYSYC